MLRLLSFTCLLLAAASAGAKAGSGEGSDAVRAAIKRALENEYYPGSSVQEILIAEPEAIGRKSTYAGEFTLKHKGRTVHCEDWHFTIERHVNGVVISNTARGRCND